MAANANKKSLSDLQKVMELMGEAYYFTKALSATDLTTTEDFLSKADFEMPIGEDGVTFDVGDPDITKKKITAGINWITYAKRGDDDITFQVPSFADPVNELFLTKKSTAAASVKVGTDTYSGAGYSFAPKKVVGAWVFCNTDHTMVVILPHTEAYGTFKGAKGDSEGYYNVAVTPLSNTDNVDVYILQKSAA